MKSDINTSERDEITIEFDSLVSVPSEERDVQEEEPESSSE